MLCATEAKIVNHLLIHCPFSEAVFVPYFTSLTLQELARTQVRLGKDNGLKRSVFWTMPMTAYCWAIGREQNHRLCRNMNCSSSNLILQILADFIFGHVYPLRIRRPEPLPSSHIPPPSFLLILMHLLPSARTTQQKTLVNLLPVAHDLLFLFPSFHPTCSVWSFAGFCILCEGCFILYYLVLSMSVNILLMKCTGGKWGVGASGRKKRLGTTSLDGCRHLLSKGTTKTQSSPKSLEVFVQYILLVCAMRVQIIVGGAFKSSHGSGALATF